MRIKPTRLAGVFEIEFEPLEDERGCFARTFCAREFQAAGLDPRLVQANLTRSPRPGTLRGLHFQRPPHAEAKLVRCVTGAIWDVVVDLRRQSASFGQWAAFELSGASLRSLYVGAGFAHGFVTLATDTEVLYNMSEFHHPESAAGIRWNDPRLAIPWPIRDVLVSSKDAALPLFDAAV